MKKTLLCFLFLFTTAFYAQINDIEHCYGDSQFNLKINESVLLDNLNPAETTISYHLSSQDANANTNAIAQPTAYTSLAASTAIYARIDNNGTVNIKSFNLKVYQELISTAITTPVRCYGQNDGTLTVIPSGGKTPYAYSLDGGPFTIYNGNPIANFLNLSSGNHIVIVKDALGCVAMPQPVQIHEPAVLLALTSIDNQNAIITATGGTVPYQYSLNGANYQASNIFSNITPGSYSFYVRDSNGCLTTVPLTVSPPLNVAVAVTKEADCNSGATITINATGGQPQYSYSINGGITYQSQNFFINIPPGNYTVKVRDAANTVSSETPIVIRTPSPIAVNTSIKPIDCISNAIVTVSATGGQGPYFYSLDGGITYVTNNTFSNILAGTYRIVVKDQKNCISSLLNVAIQPFSPLSATASNTQLVCAKDKSTLTINTNGGQFPYQYALDNNPYSASNVYPNLSPGTYTIRVKDANDCLYTLVSNIVQPTPIYPDILVQGQTLTLNGQAGTAPYEYSVDFAAYQSGNVFSNLSPGIHIVRLKDSKGCESFDFSARIEDLQPLTSAAVITKTLDCMSGATIVANATGGQPPYTYSLNGTTPYQSNNTFSNILTGTFTIRVKDALSNISNSNQVTVTPPANVIATAAVTPADCMNNATIVVTATGGQAPYTYSRDNGITYNVSNVFTNVSPGTYRIIVKDSKGCTSSSVSTTIQPLIPLIITATNTSTFCNGAGDASITINASGGKAPYQYSLNNGAYSSSNTYTGLIAGVYNLTVRDALGCMSTISYVITQPTALVANISTSGSEITVTASGGTAPYQYSLDGNSFQSSNVLRALVSGNYLVQVKDAKGCTTIFATNIVVPDPLTSSAIITKELDCMSGASVTINAAGGQPPYVYSINGGISYQTTNTFSNISAGTYTVKVRDAANTISNSNTIVLNNPSPVNATTFVTQTDCTGKATIRVQAMGGQAPYIYSLNGGVYASADTFYNLSPGNYAITVKDSNGCLSSTVVTTIQPVVPLVITATNTSISCNGGADASLTINSSGGQAPYQYSINNGAYSSNNTFTGLISGTYSIKVRDALGCASTIDYVITQPTVLTAVLTTSGSEITVTASGGTAPYQYSLDGISYLSSNVLRASVSGNYLVQVKDSQGCIATFATVIEVSDSLTSTAVITKTLDCLSNAAITVSASGGQSPYFYSVDGGGTYQSGNVFTDLVEGTYNIIVKDAANTISNTSTIVINPAKKLNAYISISKPLDCNGSAILTATVIGGTPPYLYSVDNEPYVSSNNFNKNAGTYTVNVKDDAGCIYSSTLTVAPYRNLTMSPQIVNAQCYGSSDGSIVILVNGGVAPYMFSVGSGYQSSNVFKNLAAGTYVAYVKDKLGCLFFTSVKINQPTAIAIKANITNAICYGSATGAIDVTASGGTSPYSYAIDGSVYSANKTFTSLTGGVHNVSVKDSRGCIVSYSATIAQPNALVLDVDIKSLNNDGAIGGYIKLNASGGKAPYLYSVRNDTRGVQVSLNQNIRFYSGMTEGSYTISVTDANGCKTTIDNVIVKITNPIVLNAVKTPISCLKNASLVVNASGGVAPYLYSYDGGVTYTSSNPGRTNLTPGTFSILLKDAIGNEAQSHFTVKAYDAVKTTATVTYETAEGYVDGVITMSTINGVAPYTYKVKDSATGKIIFDNSLSVGYVGLPEGTYTITAKDANGCESQSVDATLVLPGPISISISNVSPITCENPGESLTLNASGGTAPYLYSFNAGVTYRTINSVANLQSGGNYIFYAKDAIGNTSRITYKVKAYVPLTLDLTKTDVNCNGAQDGTIVANVAGGTAPYTYSLGTVFTSSKVFNNLPAGSYNVTVKDAAGCTTISKITIVEPTLLSVSTSVVNATDTNGGKITVTTFGGGTAPYTYSLQNNNGTIVIPQQTSNVFTDLTPGSYSVKVTDSRGCIFLQSGVNVLSPSPLLATYTIIPISCDNPAIIAVVAAGGTAPYTYSFDNGITYTTSNLFSTFAPGNYEIKVRDVQNNITSLIAVLSPLKPLSIVVRIVTPVNCSQNGVIEAIVSGGQAPYDYSINGGPFQTSNIFNVPAGTHIISARDVNGCSVMIAIESKQPEPLVASINVEDHTATITVTGGLAPYLYAISPNLNAFSPNNAFTNLEVGNYSAIVQDASGCYVTFNFTVEPPAPLAEGKNATTIEFKPGQTLADLIVEGENIQWYSSQNPSGGKNSKTNETPLPLTTVLVDGVTYYASQTINGIESKDRLAVTAKLNGALSTSDFILPNFKYYPNPVKHLLTINNTSVIDEIEIYSVSGASVLSKKIDSDHADIDLSNVSSGFYLLKVKAEGQVKIVKLVKK